MYRPETLALPQVCDLEPYQPGLSPGDLVRRLGITDTVKLASNENPWGPSPLAVAAMARAAREVHRYPDAAAVRLREALAARHGVAVDEIALGHGSNDLIALICRTFAGPKQHAVIGVPSFIAYKLSLQAAGVPFTEVPLRGHWFWDLDRVKQAIRPETRLCFLDNPNNPTSTHIPVDALAAFVSSVPEHVIVVVDEAYGPLVEAGDYGSALGLRQRARGGLVVLQTFSKVFGLAAARVGYAIADPMLVELLGRVASPFGVSSLAQAAALAALEDQAHVDRYLAMNAQERRRVSSELLALGLQVAPSQANFLCVRFDDDATSVFEQLLGYGIIVRQLGAPLRDALRISLGTPAENDRLLVGLRAIQDMALDSHGTTL
jgi:histidinol-phosphate aminotransferase